MTGKLKDLTINRDGTQNVTVTVSSDFRKEFDRLKNGDVNVEIKKNSKRRSLDANNFCWALCSDIGRALNPPLSKEEVYRRAIKAVGVYTPFPLKEGDVEKVKRRWNSHGTGWFIEIVDDSKLKGYKLAFMFYGSSSYDTEEMSRLIDYLVDDAEQMGLTIPLSKAEQQRMLEQWGKS